ncbi:hypothetical protein E3N88_16479 [Mikania micrantha]|uniref:Uncharacterized protein n=1 Tax=Mikania micrantha TaxID=192012 RepID=A0A5N6NYK0_9ASTR|nr:hypothetical protein E3N88_16479 [Mikania micrantha]
MMTEAGAKETSKPSQDDSEGIVTFQRGKDSPIIQAPTHLAVSPLTEESKEILTDGTLTAPCLLCSCSFLFALYVLKQLAGEN